MHALFVYALSIVDEPEDIMANMNYAKDRMGYQREILRGYITSYQSCPESFGSLNEKMRGRQAEIVKRGGYGNRLLEDNDHADE